MRPRRNRTPTVAAVVLATMLTAAVMPGCALASPLRFAAAVAGPGCTQEDYAAMIVRLSQPSVGAGEVTIEVAGELKAPFRLVLSPLRRDVTRLNQPFARAALATAAGETVWLSGSLRVRRMVRGEVVEGSYDFRTPDGQVMRGDFAAPWQAGGGECG